MERLKSMSLKKAFFTISLSFLLTGILLGAGAFLICMELLLQMDTGDRIIINYNNNIPQTVTEPGSRANDWRIETLHILQVALPVLFVIAALLLAAMVFYRLKLKKPLAVLQSGTKRIAAQDLDFSVEKCADDELGELCAAFEGMRAELLKNKRELWRQMEERKCLNAAFSHDLRNPVTVLKGSAKNLQRAVLQGDLPLDTIRKNVDLITQYAGRIENYVEAMSGAQKLEDLKCAKRPADWSAFAHELESGLTVLSADAKKQLQFSFHGGGQIIWADKNIIQNTAENLISNALRYARSAVTVNLGLDGERITLCVTDDGPGFSGTILSRGAEPFLRDEPAGGHEHFGMGLYVCRLLCEKHGGGLTLANSDDGGAAVTAAFSILKP